MRQSRTVTDAVVALGEHAEIEGTSTVHRWLQGRGSQASTITKCKQGLLQLSSSVRQTLLEYVGLDPMIQAFIVSSLDKTAAQPVASSGPLDPGNYLATIEKIRIGTSEKGKPAFRIKLRVDTYDRAVWVTDVLIFQLIERITSLTEALGMDPAEKPTAIEVCEKALGRTVVVRLIKTIFKGKTRNLVDDYLPRTAVSANTAVLESEPAEPEPAEPESPAQVDAPKLQQIKRLRDLLGLPSFDCSILSDDALAEVVDRLTKKLIAAACGDTP